MRVKRSSAADSSDDFRDTLTDITAPLGTVSIGGTRQGNIETLGDTDVFSISLIAGQGYTFSARGADSSGGTNPDPVLELLDSGGTTLEWNDDANGDTLDSLITYTATSTGTFYLVAAGYDLSTGTYTLSAATFDDDFRDTVTDMTAPLGTLTVGGIRQGNVETIYDTDVFSISLIAGQVYTFSAQGADSNGGTNPDPILGLIDGAGTLLASNDDANDATYDSFITYTATSTGTFYLTAGGFGTATGTYTLSAATSALNDTSNDFNGDGRSDILWRHESGQLINWLGQANGGFVSNADANAGTDWHIVSIGDFNGDGRDDVLWRNDNGSLTNWLSHAQGSFASNFENAYYQVATSWQVAGTGDFNGDGRDDILWRHQSGQMINWLGQANGGFVSNADANAGTDWQIAGFGDFNGDGRDDVLWRNVNTGELTDWFGQTNGSFASNFEDAYYQVATSWQVAGTGDFNGDGRDDILWRHQSGQMINWLGQANGGFVSNADANAGTDWHIVSIGDFNGDGRDDVLWRNDNGSLTNWLGQANGSFASNFENAYYEVDNSWDVQPDSFIV